MKKSVTGTNSPSKALITCMLSLLLIFLGNWSYAQPANNRCDDAQVIVIPASGTICVTGNSAGATTSGELNSCKTRATREVWYKFIAAGSNNIAVVRPTGTTPIDSAIVTMRDVACGTLTHDGCAGLTGDSSKISVGYATGTEIWVDVASASRVDGEFELCITSKDPAPWPTNTCEEAGWIVNKDTFTVSTLQGHSSSGIRPSCFGKAVGQDIWYKFKPSKTGELKWTCTPSGADVELDWAIYDITSGCPDPQDPDDIQSKEFACNYNYSGPGNRDAVGMQNMVGAFDAPECPQSSVSNTRHQEFCQPETVFAGRTYALMVDNFDGDGTGLEFTWEGTFEIGHPDSTLDADSMVWPGDANNDYIANYLDILPLGLTFNNQGPERTVQGTTWMAHQADPWTTEFRNGLNHKHADCDGDSTVALADVMAIVTNYGQTHNKNERSNETESSPPLFLDFKEDSVEAGTSVSVEVHLGSSTQQLDSIYGIAFAINYNPNLIDSGSMNIDFNGSWLGDSSETITVTKVFDETGRMEVGICRKNHMNISGSGQIGTLSFVMEDNLAGKTQEFRKDSITPTFSGVKAITYSEYEIALSHQINKLYVWENVNSIVDPPLNELIQVFPNPASTLLNITYRGNDRLQLKLFDVAGRLVISKEINSGSERLDLGDIPRGVYNLTITSTNVFNTEPYNKQVILINN